LLTEIALFPIPDVVAFPGTIVPLHVFEPRYRRLVHESVEADRPIGVCHTRKTIRDAPKRQTADEALSSNQATYQPHEIFSAGACEIHEVLEDGRIVALIHMDNRYIIAEERQTLPYRIVAAARLPDAPDEDGGSLEELQALIHTKVLEIFQKSGDADAAEHLATDWPNLSPGAFSFQLFNYLRFDADFMQLILESTHPRDRLQNIWDVLRNLE
jgi:Lon protease-like protein